MSDNEVIKYTPLRKMKLANETVDQKAFAAAVQAKTGLPIEVVKHCIKVSLDQNPQLPDNLDKASIAKANQIIKAAGESFRIVYREAEIKRKEDEEKAAAEKARREKEKAELEEKKKELSLLFEEANVQSTEIVQAGRFENLRDELVQGALGEHFVLADGNIVLKEGEDAKRAFADGFANLNRIINTADDMKGGVAIYEAKLALAAKNHPDIGDLWPNYFNGATDTDIARIKKGIAALETAGKLGVDLGTVPLSTARVIFEAKYSQDEDENEKLKKKAFETFVEKSNEAGSILPQTAAKALVSELRPKTNRGDARVNWSYVYKLKDGGFVGSSKFDSVLFGKADFCIAKNLDIVTVDAEGDPVYTQVPAPTAEAPKAPEEPTKEEKPAAKKTAKKAAKKTEAPAPAPVETPKEEPEGSVEDTSATPDGEPEEDVNQDTTDTSKEVSFGLDDL